MKAWNRFFFEPISPVTIGLFRIVFGSVIFLAILGRFPSRDIFYGRNAIVSYQTMNAFFPGHPMFFFRWLPLDEPALAIYFGVLLALCVSLIVGYRTRLSSILVFLGLMSLSNRNFFVDNGGDDLMRINAFFLMFCEAGAAFSVDCFLRRKSGAKEKKRQLVVPWAQRMLQLQVAYLYFETAVLKLNGASWMDGTALYYSLNYLELRRFDFRFLFAQLWQVKLATYGTILAEFSAFSLIWFRRFRYQVLIVAVVLHLTINLLMQFPVFQYVMIASLINFIYPEDIEKISSGISKLWDKYS